jgi:hypothetical protein
MGATYSSETSVDFNGLHVVVSQNIELFITTAVRTSNPETSYIPAAQFIVFTLHIGSQRLIYMRESQ